MTPTEIIREDSLSRNIDPDKTLKNIAYMVKNGNATLIQHGDTVLFLLRFSPKAVELHLFTKDSPLGLISAVRKFVETIRKTNLEAVYGRADNEGILALLRRAGVNVEKSNMPQYNWMAKV
jgi:hypothetical protein